MIEHKNPSIKKLVQVMSDTNFLIRENPCECLKGIEFINSKK